MIGSLQLPRASRLFTILLECQICWNNKKRIALGIPITNIKNMELCLPLNPGIFTGNDARSYSNQNDTKLRVNKRQTILVVTLSRVSKVLKGYTRFYKFQKFPSILNPPPLSHLGHPLSLRKAPRSNPNRKFTCCM